MWFERVREIHDAFQGIAEVRDGQVEILDAQRLRGDLWDRLAGTAVFAPDPEVRGEARWWIKAVALAAGIRPASIQDLYEAMGRGEVGGYTVPAINIRGMSYDVARAVVRAAQAHQVGAFIFEIARSEIGYTQQSPAEYAAVMLAALVKEGYRGPAFIQGDHFQVSAKKYAQNPDGEIQVLHQLIDEALGAGFYNIDVDTSTLVDLSHPTLKEQQRKNFELAAQFTRYIREREPQGVTVSVGGEIGEVGGKNSTVEELRAFMDHYLELLDGTIKGISKISVQTGTTHGGVPLPDGTIAKVKLDFDTLERLSKVAREEYGLAGAVQHGASTLPDEAFHRFPETGTAEIHLATGFQNMIYDHPLFPESFREEIYTYLRDKHGNERKEGDTEEQFLYKTRKKGFGPFKERFWTLPENIREAIGKQLEAKFAFLFQKLRVAGTRAVVDRYIQSPAIYPDREWEVKTCRAHPV